MYKILERQFKGKDRIIGGLQGKEDGFVLVEDRGDYDNGNASAVRKRASGDKAVDRFDLSSGWDDCGI